jgi:hypothetical protein
MAIIIIAFIEKDVYYHSPDGGQLVNEIIKKKIEDSAVFFFLVDFVYSK